MRVRTLLTLILCLISISLSGQSLTKLRTISIKNAPQSVSIDRQGQFYIASKNGDIDKYDIGGELLYHFSPPKNGAVSLIEAWQGLRIFTYYKDFQEYAFLDRFLSTSKRFTLPNDMVSFSSLVTTSGDDNLWLINAQQLSLKKIDLPSNDAIIETPFSLNINSSTFDFKHLREYQNQVFLSAANLGVLIFDRFGNFTEIIEEVGVDYFTFNDKELLFQKNGVVTLIDIYTKTKREIELADPSYQFVLMENSTLICIADSKIDLYKIN